MQKVNQPANPGRRHFLKVGIGASATLVLISGAMSLTTCESNSTHPHSVIQSRDQMLLASLAPALLGVTFTKAEQDAFLTRWLALAHTGHPALHRDLRQLFDLLHCRGSRWPLTGLWHPIPEATPAQRAAFLTRWQDSRIRLLRFGHQGLTQLAQMAWYSMPQSWPPTGYPGPPVTSGQGESAT